MSPITRFIKTSTGRITTASTVATDTRQLLIVAELDVGRIHLSLLRYRLDDRRRVPYQHAMPVTTSRPRAYALLHITVFVWGLTAILGKAITLPAMSLVFYRLVLVVAIAGARVVLQKEPLPSVHALSRFAAVGACIAVHWACFYSCIKDAGVAVAVLCLSTIPFMTAFITAAMNRRPPPARDVAIGALATVGVFFLLRFEANTTTQGVLLGFGSAVFSALFGSYNGKLSQQHKPAVITAYELGFALVVFPVFFVLVPQSFVSPDAITGIDAILMLVLAVLCTVLPWDWSLRAASVLGAFTVSLAIVLEPVYSILVAWVVFPNEKITPGFFVGTLLIVGLLLWNARTRTR
jgi:drug/metabolite transporter (DMT)-like permease